MEFDKATALSACASEPLSVAVAHCDPETVMMVLGHIELCISKLFRFFGQSAAPEFLSETAAWLLREYPDLSLDDWAAFVNVVRHGKATVDAAEDPRELGEMNERELRRRTAYEDSQRRQNNLSDTAPQTITFHEGTVYNNLSTALIATWLDHFRYLKAAAREQYNRMPKAPTLREESPNLEAVRKAGEHFHALINRWDTPGNLYPIGRELREVAAMVDSGAMTLEGLRAIYAYLTRRGPEGGLRVPSFSWVWQEYKSLLTEMVEAQRMESPLVNGINAEAIYRSHYRP